MADELLARARTYLGEDFQADLADPESLNGLLAALDQVADDDEALDLRDEVLLHKVEVQGFATRAASIAELESVGLIAPPESLPALLEVFGGYRRSVQEVVDRIRGLTWVLGAAFSDDVAHVRDDLLPNIASRGLVDAISEHEHTMLDLIINEHEHAAQDKIQIGWRVEAISTLGWALGVYDELPLTGTQGPNPEDFAGIDPWAAAGTPAGVHLRPETELMARLDVFYCAHWNIVNHHVAGQPAELPAAVVPGAVVERRHALEWLLSGYDWDDIDMST